MLDWIEVVRPQRGDILVMRVPDDKFVHPGTAREDITDEQHETMTTCHRVIGEVINNVARMGIQLGHHGRVDEAGGSASATATDPDSPAEDLAPTRDAGVMLAEGVYISGTVLVLIAIAILIFIILRK
jgi:hypothetical protein